MFGYVEPFSLLTPNSGERLVTGSTYDITWESDGFAANVLLEYSSNNGTDWTTVDTVANTGSYQWTVPDANSNQCLVCISDANNIDINDTSDDVFTIFDCQKTMAGDLTGDCYVGLPDLDDFVGQWLDFGDPGDCQLSAELSGNDCLVNLRDLAILAGWWLECGNPFDPSCQP